MDIDREGISEIIEETARRVAAVAAAKAVETFMENHPCRLSDSEYSMIQAAGIAHKEEKADHGTWRIIIQMGKGYQDVTSGFRKFGIAVLVVIVLAGMYMAYVTGHGK